MEVVLMGLAGCAGIDVVSILKKRRTPFTGLQIKATGERAEEHPRRYTHIYIKFEVYGRGIKTKDVQRAIELSMTKYCSAIASINAEIKHSFRIVEEDLLVDG
jgi:putative redox protein